MFRLLARLGVGGTLGVIVLSAALLFSNAWTYVRLTHETPVGEISFAALGDKRFAVKFVDANAQKSHSFELVGDQWRFDTRILKWKTWATLLGKDPLYQLDRVSGRYVDADTERNAPPTLYAFSAASWFDPWYLAKNYPDTFFMADASYGSSIYLPMEDGAKYAISMSMTGLLARQVNPAQNPS